MFNLFSLIYGFYKPKKQSIELKVNKYQYFINCENNDDTLLISLYNNRSLDLQQILDDIENPEKYKQIQLKMIGGHELDLTRFINVEELYITNGTYLTINQVPPKIKEICFRMINLHLPYVESITELITTGSMSESSFDFTKYYHKYKLDLAFNYSDFIAKVTMTYFSLKPTEEELDEFFDSYMQDLNTKEYNEKLKKEKNAKLLNLT